MVRKAALDKCLIYFVVVIMCHAAQILAGAWKAALTMPKCLLMSEIVPSFESTCFLGVLILHYNVKSLCALPMCCISIFSVFTSYQCFH